MPEALSAFAEREGAADMGTKAMGDIFDCITVSPSGVLSLSLAKPDPSERDYIFALGSLLSVLDDQASERSVTVADLLFLYSAMAVHAWESRRDASLLAALLRRGQANKQAQQLAAEVLKGAALPPARKSASRDRKIALELETLKRAGVPAEKAKARIADRFSVTVKRVEQITGAPAMKAWIRERFASLQPGQTASAFL
jgi:hypothetical protein